MKKSLAIASMACALFAAPSHAEWRFENRTDAMTDRVELAATLMGSDGILQLLCRRGASPTMLILPLAPMRGLNSRRQPRDTMFRFDEQPPIVQSWLYGDGNAVTINEGYIADLIVPLATSARLRVRLTGPGYRAIDMAFDLTGTPEAIRRIRAACR